MAEADARYGSDIRLNDSGDVTFAPDGDLEVVTGGALVAQDIRSEAMLSPGSCFWARSFGRGLSDALKGPDIDVAAALRAAAFNDERVDFDSVTTKRLDDGRYVLSFRLFGAVDQQELYFDLKGRFDDVD